MTTPTTQPDRITAQEIRDLFAGMSEEIDELRERIVSMNNFMHTIREGLQQAASQPAPQVGTFTEMMIDTIIMSYDDNGKATYKAKGAPFQKFGVRVWEEVIGQFADPDTLKPGKNTITPTAARVLMGETTNTETGVKGIGPRKITGKV